MKVKTYVRLSKQLRQKINDAINLHTEMKNSYFWSPPCNASGRRRMERERSLELDFILRDVHYQVSLDTRCSCSNVYYSSSIQVDGQSKDIRALKKIVRA